MSKTIMVVDDSKSIRQLIGVTLKSAGYQVIEACDGKEGLAKLDGSKISLIISDVNMPNMDGITFVQEVKKLDAYKFTPMMMLTTEAADDKKQAGRAAGAKAWLTKPFQAPTLLDAVSKLVLP